MSVTTEMEMESGYNTQHRIMTINNNHSFRTVIAITGASGACYGMRLTECLIQSGQSLYFLMSDAARLVLKSELNVDLIHADTTVIEHYLTERFRGKKGQIIVLNHMDWMAPIASGSGAFSAMVICPCSMGTLSSIACGLSQNLIQRAAAVALKERKPLIMMPREAPYSEIHLEHMLKLTRMGVTILPASPGFYHQPQTIQEIVDFMVAKVLMQLTIPQALLPAWGTSYEESQT